ncbi:GNAT family N-acetyltransferase [Peribacillus kribbensis]|uniref:GNAT family N-acetyltransferase n=1 Tax=Peribacillus kribbensis TaxID=356658 RepID=UPI000684A53E|nr:GNAT family N-acetyltransferase [Peribacillus kribbensis]
MMHSILHAGILNKIFRVLDGSPVYIQLEEKNNLTIREEEIEKAVTQAASLIDLNIDRVGAFILQSTSHYSRMKTELIRLGFEFYTARVEVHRGLEDVREMQGEAEWRTMGEKGLSPEFFKEIWRQCMIGSANKASSMTMDQHLASVQRELGEGWEASCKAAFLKENPIALAIPHIEPGRKNEGRLFYFGLMPAHRGRGLSKMLHYQTLWMLKGMGAEYYIGSTHTTNMAMQRVFTLNSCTVSRVVDSFYLTN